MNTETEKKQTVKRTEDFLSKSLHRIILLGIRILAILMVVVIIAGVIDVALIVYDKILIHKPFGYFHIEEILTILGAFIGVLIAIEIFNNITVYLQEDSIHVKLVLSTALIAISRKVIILDYKTMEPNYIYATAAVIVATAISYWIVSRKIS